MSDHPDLAQMYRYVAENDPDDEVRSEAVYGMRGFLSPGDAVAYARARLAADPTERMAWTALSVAQSSDEDPSSRTLLSELARSPFSDVAASARSALS